jgi:hypothetical protein
MRGMANCKFQITEFRKIHLEFGICNLESEIWNRRRSRVYDCATALRIWRIVSA